MRRRTILLADDSPTIRRLVTQTFADANFKIVEVNNGDAAIKTFEEVRPDIVLADVYMPGKNGYQVCEHIRKHKELGKTPVILLVGAFDAFDEDGAKEAGANANITKPFEPAALIEMVNFVLTEEATAQAAAAEATSTTASATVAAAVETSASTDSEDLFGLETIFKEEPPPAAPAPALSDQDIDRIADRVIQRMSKEVVESIAWEIVPDISEKIVREELKRNR